MQHTRQDYEFGGQLPAMRGGDGAGGVLDTVPNPNAHLDMTLAEYQVWLRAFVYQAWLRAFVYQARLCAFVWEVLGLSPSLCRRSGHVSVGVGVGALHLRLMCMSLYDI